MLSFKTFINILILRSRSSSRSTHLTQHWVHFISAKMASYSTTCNWIVDPIMTGIQYSILSLQRCDNLNTSFWKSTFNIKFPFCTHPIWLHVYINMVLITHQCYLLHAHFYKEHHLWYCNYIFSFVYAKRFYSSFLILDNICYELEN